MSIFRGGLDIFLKAGIGFFLELNWPKKKKTMASISGTENYKNMEEKNLGRDIDCRRQWRNLFNSQQKCCWRNMQKMVTIEKDPRRIPFWSLIHSFGCDSFWIPWDFRRRHAVALPARRASIGQTKIKGNKQIPKSVVDFNQLAPFGDVEMAVPGLLERRGPPIFISQAPWAKNEKIGRHTFCWPSSSGKAKWFRFEQALQPEKSSWQAEILKKTICRYHLRQSASMKNVFSIIEKSRRKQTPNIPDTRGKWHR